MKVNEIFFSIQGEGKWSGLPNIFIRTSGCNLRCSFCDTKYAYSDGVEMSIKQIISRIKNYPSTNICITGGEPLLQTDIYELIKKLLEKNYNICIETNGSINIKNLIKIKTVLISLDIKCPSSNMKDKNYLKNIKLLRESDQIKFVIKNKVDYNYSKKILIQYKPACDIFFQPVWGINPKFLANLILKDGLNIKLGFQLHKIIWNDEKSK
jgi:7-carboxy-7-deazaguanine synthase